MLDLFLYIRYGLPKFWTYSRWRLEETIKVEYRVLDYLSWGHARDDQFIRLYNRQLEKIYRLTSLRDGKYKAKPSDLIL